MSSFKNKTVFVAVLNWGLGHATRSIPIINELISLKAKVILGGDGRSLKLLEKEFPHLKTVELPSYGVLYSEGSQMVATTLFRAPKYLNAVRLEHQALEKLIDEHKIDVVISDNRYGLWTKKVKSIFVCHQLALIPPQPFDWATSAVYRLHRLFMDRYDEIWIPDFDKAHSLAGRLVHQFPFTSKMKLIGALSRFNDCISSGSITEFGIIDIVCVLSGPEPQRSLLENKMREQAQLIDRDILIVQGKTETYKVERDGRITTISYLTSNVLYSILKEANVVIARSGYSTIMDLAALGKKAILIPTPGQTEQVYLANNLSDKHIAVVQQQSQLNIAIALNDIENVKGFPMNGNHDLLKAVMNDLVL
ncbi:MAG: glycosyltransferase [Chitinophagales bacterium]